VRRPQPDGSTVFYLWSSFLGQVFYNHYGQQRVRVEAAEGVDVEGSYAHFSKEGFIGYGSQTGSPGDIAVNAQGVRTMP
jgi:hypothetical protein